MLRDSLRMMEGAALLFFGLGVLTEGKLQQPAERFSPRFKSVVEPEIFNLSE